MKDQIKKWGNYHFETIDLESIYLEVILNHFWSHVFSKYGWLRIIGRDEESFQLMMIWFNYWITIFIIDINLSRCLFFSLVVFYYRSTFEHIIMVTNRFSSLFYLLSDPKITIYSNCHQHASLVSFFKTFNTSIDHTLTGYSVVKNPLIFLLGWKELESPRMCTSMALVKSLLFLCCFWVS